MAGPGEVGARVSCAKLARVTGTGARPLDGVRVVEVGQALAGPWAGAVLGYFGAEVIKVEPPGGDPLRNWRLLDDDGTSVWWRSVARNKKCVTIDLRKDAGRALVRRLVGKADALVENFRPGTMEKWGLGPDDLGRDHPRLVYARVSGFGQTGPYASRAGYASVAEAMGGLRHLTGMPGEPPVRSNLSLGDTLAGLHAAFGVVLALYHRDRAREPGAGKVARAPSGEGQVVDVALTESVLSMLEGVIPEYDRFGVARAPSGPTVTGIVPSNTYRARDGRFVVIGANGDSIYVRLMHAIGRDDLAQDPTLATNAGRVAQAARVDDAIQAWVALRDVRDVVETLEAVSVPAGPIYDAADIARDPHYQARGLFERVDVGGRPLSVPAIAPRLVDTPGRTDTAGPELGAHNEEVLLGLLGLDRAELDGLVRDGVV